MSQWGVKSERGIVTVAPRGKVQAEQWAEYKFRPGAIGDVGERLVEIPAEASAAQEVAAAFANQQNAIDNLIAGAAGISPEEAKRLFYGGQKQ